MAHFYLDENMPLQLVLELQGFGHTAVTADDLGLKRAGDDEQLLVAAGNGWTLVTRDKDYLLLHDAWLRWSAAWHVQVNHAGILLTPHKWLVPQAALEIHTFIQGGQPLTNYLYQWQHGAWIPHGMP